MDDKWNETTIGEFCPFTYGKGLSEKIRKPGNIKVFGSNGRVGFHNEALVSQAGIIIGRKGTIGTIHYSKEPFWPIDTTFYITETIYRDLKFTYYLLKSLELHQMNTDSAVPGLNREAAHSKKVAIPSLIEQRRISNILGTLDEKIELNQQINETLEAIAQTLFQSWFIDFDPVIDKVLVSGKEIPKQLQEKAARREMLGNQRKSLPFEIESLFPDEFVESDLGWIPKGWTSKLLGDILTPKKGKTITKEKCIKGSIPVIAGGLKPAYYHNQYNVSSSAITISASGANAGYVSLHHRNIWASDCSYIGNEQTSTPYLYYIFLKINQKRIFEMQHGAAQPHIYPVDIMRLPIIYPNNQILWEQANQLLSPLFLQIGKNLSESEILINIRDILLPKLISGEIRISEAEVIVERALNV